MNLSHIDKDGRAVMVDVGHKPISQRTAKAKGRLVVKPETLQLTAEGKTPKGAVISTAEIAGIMAAKQTHALIPMCHPLNLTKIKVAISMDVVHSCFHIESEVGLSGQTGVEMEALMAVSVAGLTLYDMLKAVDKTMRLEGVEVVEKTGGTKGLDLSL